MKKGLLLLIAIVFSFNVGFIESSNAQGNRNSQHQNHKKHNRNKDYRHEGRKIQNHNKYDNRNSNRYENRYDKQYRHPNKDVRRHKKVVYKQHNQHRNQMPFWASAHRYRGGHAVYFRDYNAFYDPYRGGYIYWHKNTWRFSRKVPRYMSNYDLNRARVHVIKDVPYGSRPELHYGKYAKRYPRNNRIQINIGLPPY